MLVTLATLMLSTMRKCHQRQKTLSYKKRLICVYKICYLRVHGIRTNGAGNVELDNFLTRRAVFGSLVLNLIIIMATLNYKNVMKIYSWFFSRDNLGKHLQLGGNKVVKLRGTVNSKVYVVRILAYQSDIVNQSFHSS